MKQRSTKSGPIALAKTDGSAWGNGAAMNVQDIWREAEKRRVEYRTKGEELLLKEMQDKYLGLKSLGWNDAVYCPKDGSRFLAIEAGSIGVFPCTYKGEWPNGTYWTEADGDLWPSRPILYKPMPKEQP